MTEVSEIKLDTIYKYRPEPEQIAFERGRKVGAGQKATDSWMIGAVMGFIAGAIVAIFMLWPFVVAK